MTIDPVELERLSKAATQGVWEHEFRGGHTSQGEVTCGKHSVITVNGGNFAQWRDAPDDGEAEFKANGDFVCALVNAYRTGQLVPAQPSGPKITDDQIKHMANRFLGWKLPANFRPDNGISFEPVGNKGVPGKEYCRDVSGTNLFDAVQAEAMVRFMVEGIPTAQPSGDEVEAVARAICGASGDVWRTGEGMRSPFAAQADRVNNHWRFKATAAITALDAVRGKQ